MPESVYFHERVCASQVSYADSEISLSICGLVPPTPFMGDSRVFPNRSLNLGMPDGVQLDTQGFKGV